MVRVLLGRHSTPDYSKMDNVEAALAEIRDGGGWDHAVFLMNFRGWRAALVTERKDRFPDVEEFSEASGLSLETIEEFETDFFPNPPMAILAKYAYPLGLEVRVRAVEKEAP